MTSELNAWGRAPALCLTCPAPALSGHEHCAGCYNAIHTPDPTCDCGALLTPADIAAGETACLACAGLELQATIDLDSPLLAIVKTRLAQTAPGELYCSGSMTAPALRGGKPHCAVCGQAFKWQEMVDRVRFVPEH